jgi:peroxiredoxin
MSNVDHGVKAPEMDVTLSTGEVVPLRTLYQEERMLLVFLRHFGCIFCREYVSQLKSLDSANIVFVTLGRPEQAAEFKKSMGSPHRFLCDPNKELHKHFNLQRGGMAQMFKPSVVVRGIKAMSSGHGVGMAVGDPWQMPGVFLVETDGTVTWEYYSQDASDNPAVGEVEGRLGGQLVG